MEQRTEEKEPVIIFSLFSRKQFHFPVHFYLFFLWLWFEDLYAICFIRHGSLDRPDFQTESFSQ